MIVPELPAEIRELKQRVGGFVEAEVYPLEQRIVEAQVLAQHPEQRHVAAHGHVVALPVDVQNDGGSLSDTS